jgi:hypothetical protein
MGSLSISNQACPALNQASRRAINNFNQQSAISNPQSSVRNRQYVFAAFTAYSGRE